MYRSGKPFEKHIAKCSTVSSSPPPPFCFAFADLHFLLEYGEAASSGSKKRKAPVPVPPIEQPTASAARVIIFDVETTGFRRSEKFHDRVWQVAAYEPQAGRDYSATINPDIAHRLWQPQARTMALRNNPNLLAVLQGRPKYPAAAKAFIDWLNPIGDQQLIFVSHNSSFDKTMLTHWMTSTGNKDRLHYHFINTLPLARLLLPAQKSHKQEEVQFIRHLLIDLLANASSSVAGQSACNSE